MTHIYKSDSAYTIAKETEGIIQRVETLDLDALFQSDNPAAWLDRILESAPDERAEGFDPLTQRWRAPVQNQEIWAAGVTYFKSREARMEESEEAGGDVFYRLVYDAARPELFLKATAARARGHLDTVRIRDDSEWNVPEPELTLAINAKGRIFGYTIGNDMSSRSIEGENPLYLPQAKVYKGSCAIGPALVVGDPPAKDAAIRIAVARDGSEVFRGETDLTQIKRSFEELAEYLFRDNEFPHGALLMTGTGIVPGAEFTLKSGDVIRISIDGLGTLENAVE